MGYAFYDLEDGMGERGYGVADVCRHPGCTEEIDRGMAFLCYACTRYFCAEHLTFTDDDHQRFAGESSQVCMACAAKPNQTRSGS